MWSPRILFQKIDWISLIAILLLCVLGTLTQYSLSIEPGVVISEKIFRQGIYLVLACVVYVIAVLLNYKILITRSWIFFVAMLAALLAVVLFGTELKGATGWIIIGPLSMQPVELVKLFFILYLANTLRESSEHEQRLSYRVIAITGLVTACVIGLVLAQPDLGSASIIGSIWFGFLLLARAPKRVIVLVIVGVLIAGVIGWFFLFKDFQKDRLSIFLNRESDPLGKGYNITQSMIAVGSGGIWGKGFGEGTQSQLQFLPEASSDFAFAVVAEEFGLVGASIVIGALLVICYRLLVIMRTTHDTFAFFFCGGVACYILVQSMIVVGMNIGIMPITGLPLPFISSGGSSLLATSAMLGLAQSMYLRR